MPPPISDRIPDSIIHAWRAALTSRNLSAILRNSVAPYKLNISPSNRPGWP